MIPELFCSRLPGTLDEVEQAVNVAQESASQGEAAEKLRPEITPASALRWLRRRIRYVKDTLTTVAGLLPIGCTPTPESFRYRFSTERVLVKLREVALVFLPVLPPQDQLFAATTWHRACYR